MRCFWIAFIMLGGLTPAFAQIAEPELPIVVKANDKTAIEWIKQLRESKKVEERQEAARALKEFAPSKEILTALSFAIEDADKKVKTETFFTLYSIGTPALPVLTRGIQSDDLATVVGAISTSLELNWKAHEVAVPLVRGLYPDMPDAIRTRVAMTLAAWENPDILSVVLPLLDSREQLTRGYAAYALIPFAGARPKVLQTLGDFLASRKPEEQKFSILSLRELRGEGASLVPQLLKILDDAEPGTREQIIITLGAIGPAAITAQEPLLKRLGKEVEPQLEWAIVEALWNITHDPKLAVQVKKLLKSDSEELQLRAAYLLWWIDPKDPDAIKTITRHAEKENRVGELAMNLLGRIGPDAASSTAVVATHLTEPGRPFQAAMAIKRFGEIGKKYTPQLRDLAKNSQDALTRLACTQALWDFKDPQAEELLIALLNEKKEYDRTFALRALAHTAKLPTSLAPLAKKYLENADADVQLAATGVLYAAGEKELALKELQKLLRSANDKVRLDAPLELIRYGSDAVAAVPELRRMLLDSNVDVQAAAAEALGRIGIKAKFAIPDLIRRLQTRGTSINTYSACCESLGLMGPDAKNAVPVLKLLLAHPNEYIQTNAAYALWRIVQDKTGLKQLEAGMGNRSSKVRVYSAEALWFIRKDQQSIPELIRLLNQYQMPAANDRFIAARALGRIGPDAKAALPLLRRTADSADVWLAKTATESIQKIETKSGGLMPAEIEK